MIQLSIEQGKNQLANEAGVQVQGKPIEVVELDCTISNTITSCPQVTLASQ